MPPTIPSQMDWIIQQIQIIQASLKALTTQQQIFIDNPATGTCYVIIGNIAADDKGNGTGLTGYGIASKSSGTWVQL